MAPNDSLYSSSDNGASAHHESQMIGERVAHQITGLSDRVRESSEQLANRLDDAAGYLRGRGTRDFLSDLGGVVKRHPYTALASVGGLFLLFRLMRR